MRASVKNKAKEMPPQPGVYLFKDSGGRIIYVGKAKNLKARLRSYMQDLGGLDTKHARLRKVAADLETILVDNEKEALALEDNLIKKYRPRYNVLLRDDKTYPYIKLTMYERFPRVYVTRSQKKDGSLYFGPYFPARLAYRILDLIHRRFLVPSCTVDLTRYHSRPCLEFHIKRCQGPCVESLTTPERYAEAVRDVRLLLAGRQGDLIRSLRERMQVASIDLRFEQATRYRDLAFTLEQLQQRQKLATSSGDDIDIFGFYQEGSLAAVDLFHMRCGRVVDRREFFWEDLETFDPREFFASLMKQCYLNHRYIPQAIHVPVEFNDWKILQEVLSDRRGGKMEIITPQRGKKRALLDLVARNAKHSFDRRFRLMKPTFREITDALGDALDLERPPRRIECFDVSHLQGSDIVASMVVWENGRMKKSDYRKFIIKTAPQNDDFASIREVVGRRYKRVQKERHTLPDLILIDGGIGQLHAAAQALEQLQIINQPLASIAKRDEMIFVLGKGNKPFRLDRHSPMLHLIQQIRNETHRFAVTFHRHRRTIREITTQLLVIPGIGKETARKLLDRFGSIESMRSLTLDELYCVLSRNQAVNIHEQLKKINVL